MKPDSINRPSAQLFHSDFAFLTFDEHLGNTKEDLSVMPKKKPVWVGDSSSRKTFWIEGSPVFGHSYLLITLYEVHFEGHKILINDTELPGCVLPPCKGQWLTTLVPVGVELKANDFNSIQIVRNQNRQDNFIISHVVIHWRELINGRAAGKR